MQEAFNTAKSQIETTLQDRENKRAFITFIQHTRESITGLLSPMEQLEENNYGVSIPTTIEGFFIKNIDAARDLNMPDAADYSMDVFIGREKVGPVGTWVLNKFHKEPSMVVDVAVEHKPSRTIVTNQVFIISRDRIELWDRIHTDYADRAEDLPPGQSPNTQLITDVLEYAAKHPSQLRSRK